MVFGDGPGSSSYAELAAAPAAADSEVRRDICRTFPGHMSEEATEALFRILRAVSHRLEDIGYCQGMNFIAGIFMRVFCEEGGRDAEALVYQCVVSILLRHGMNQYFGDRFPKLRLTALQFDCLVEAFLPDVSAAFEVFNLSAEFYATQWFLTLFSYSLPLEHAVRVWDNFLCRGMKFIHRVGLALLNEARPFLIGQSFDATVQRLRGLGQSTTLSPEGLVALAMEFKVTNRLLGELEHAMATGEGGQALPVCFPERDLDSGRTRWRLHKSSAAPESSASATSTATGPADGGVVFLEDALPAPRIPADPLAPRICWGSPEAAVAEAPQAAAARQRPARLRRLPKAVLQRIRSAKASSHGAPAPAPAAPVAAAAAAVAAARDPEAPSALPGPARPLPCGSQEAESSRGAGKGRSAMLRSSSMPALRLSRRKPSFSVGQSSGEVSVRAHAADQDISNLSLDSTAGSTASGGSTGSAAAPERLDTGGPRGIPKHLLPYAVRDLDTGEWALLSNSRPRDAQPLPPSSPKQQTSDKRRSWASKQVSKLRPGRSKRGGGASGEGAGAGATP